MNKLNSHGFSTGIVLTVIAVLGLVGGTGYYVSVKDKKPTSRSNQANTNTDLPEQGRQDIKEGVKDEASVSSNNLTTTGPQPSQEQTISPPQPSFNAEQFHDQVQIGMEYNKVVSLAGGQAGTCEMSNAPAPNDYMNCTWQDSSMSVSLSFQNQKVTYKSKRSL